MGVIYDKEKEKEKMHIKKVCMTTILDYFVTLSKIIIFCMV